MKKNTTELTTFPESDEFFATYFTVPTDWLVKTLKERDFFENVNEDFDLNDWLQEYVWDETYFLKSYAEADGVIENVYQR